MAGCFGLSLALCATRSCLACWSPWVPDVLLRRVLCMVCRQIGFTSAVYVTGVAWVASPTSCSSAPTL
eukprot:12381595-Alexandrium_andersonii.AAC.1